MEPSLWSNVIFEDYSAKDGAKTDWYYIVFRHSDQSALGANFRDCADETSYIKGARR